MEFPKGSLFYVQALKKEARLSPAAYIRGFEEVYACFHYKVPEIFTPALPEGTGRATIAALSYMMALTGCAAARGEFRKLRQESFVVLMEKTE